MRSNVVQWWGSVDIASICIVLSTGFRRRARGDFVRCADRSSNSRNHNNSGTAMRWAIGVSFSMALRRMSNQSLGFWV